VALGKGERRQTALLLAALACVRWLPPGGTAGAPCVTTWRRVLGFPPGAHTQACCVSQHTISTWALGEERGRASVSAPRDACPGGLIEEPISARLPRVATPPSAFTPQTTRGIGVLSRPSARQWLPRVWHTPRYPGGGHSPRRQVVYTTAADNSLNPKTRYNVSLTPSFAGTLPWYRLSCSTNSVSWRWCASS